MIESHIYNGYTIEIVQDDDSESPWEWEDITNFVSFHRGMDNQGNFDPSKFNTNNFNSPDLFEQALIEYGYITQRMYLYNHSGWAVSSTPFSCKWDSGLAGILFIDRQTAIKEWGNKICTNKVRQKATEYMVGHIETLNQYYQGEVYGYHIYHPANLDYSLESCSGYYDINDCIAEAKSVIDTF